MGLGSEIAKGVVISISVTIISTILILGILYCVVKFGLIPYFESRMPEGLVEIIKKLLG